MIYRYINIPKDIIFIKENNNFYLKTLKKFNKDDIIFKLYIENINVDKIQVIIPIVYDIINNILLFNEKKIINLNNNKFFDINHFNLYSNNPNTYIEYHKSSIYLQSSKSFCYIKALNDIDCFEILKQKLS
jgi:hypothetical protein